MPPVFFLLKYKDGKIQQTNHSTGTGRKRTGETEERKGTYSRRWRSWLAYSAISYRIGLIDDDVVSESNLQRQVLYSETEVGLPKAIQAKKRLNALNSQIKIDAYNTRLTKENAEEIICKYDIVVDGCDNFKTRYIINDTCVKLGKTYVYGAIRAFDGQVSVFNYQGGKNYRDLFPDEEEMLSMPAPPKGVIGVTPGLVGCVQANEVIKIICGFGEILSGKLWYIDLKTLQTNTILL